MWRSQMSDVQLVNEEKNKIEQELKLKELRSGQNTTSEDIFER